MYYGYTAWHFTLQKSGATESYNQVAHFKVAIQPATGESTALINGQYGKTYNAYTTYSGLNIGDILTISGTTTISGSLYHVKAVREWRGTSLPHFEAVITNPEL